ncbi:hypothetical protein ACSFA0_26305, partial [Variovorax sp. LT1P1]
HDFQRVVHALDNLLQGFDHRQGLGFHLPKTTRGRYCDRTVAHAYEVEQRRRQRLSQSQQQSLPAAPAIPSRPWWKFWAPA